MAMTKTGAQLDAEIAEALRRPTASRAAAWPAVSPDVRLTATQAAALSQHVPARFLADDDPIYGLVTAVAVVRGGGVKLTRADDDDALYFYKHVEITRGRDMTTDVRGHRSPIAWHVGRDLGYETLDDLRRAIDAGRYTRSGHAEIAAALKPPPRSKRAAVAAADLNVLAQAASFGNISVDDLAPYARTANRLSKTYLTRVRAAGARLRSLAERELLDAGGTYSEKYVLTAAGRQALVDASYAPNAACEWLKPGARRPSWSA